MSFTLCANSCSSVSEGPGGGGGGAGGALTVTRAVVLWVPPGPLALSGAVVESVGLTCLIPFGSTAPTPSMLTSVAFVVCQVKVDDCPLSIVSGLAVNVAVGAAGAGGGGGGGGGFFFPHALINRIAPSANTRAAHLNDSCFIFSSLRQLLASSY